MGRRERRTEPTAPVDFARTPLASRLRGEHDSCRRSSCRRIPDRLDIGQRPGYSVDRERPLDDLGGELREDGKDGGGTGRTLATAEEMNVGLAQSSGGKTQGSAGDGSYLDPGDQSGPILATG